MFIFIFKISENDDIPLTRNDLKMYSQDIEDHKEDLVRGPSMSSILVSFCATRSAVKFVSIFFSVCNCTHTNLTLLHFYN